VLPDGEDVLDDWESSQLGFNVRWDAGGRDVVTVRGDAYDGEKHVLTRGDFTLGTVPGPDSPGTVALSGYNVVARWRRTYDSGGSSRLQVFFDQTDRRIPGSFDETRDTYDIDWQRDMATHGRHAWTFGTGLRETSDKINNTLFATFLPPERTDRTTSAFFQDRIGFRDGRMELIVGSKLEHNDYTGFEHQPGIRYVWTPDEGRSFWAAVSRAVRTPARLNSDIELTAPITDDPVPFYVNVFGNPAFESETLQAHEAGYRIRFNESLALDFAVFDNDYDKLQTQEAGAPFVVNGPPQYLVLPIDMANGMRAETYGGTIAAVWQPFERWRLRMHYSRLQMDLSLKPGSLDGGALGIAGNSPRHQIAVHAFAELGHGLSLYGAARYISALPNQQLDSRIAVDLNLGWQVTARLKGALTVRDLNDRRHVEFGDVAIERAAYVRIAWAL
jgi:iron complex outermembrane receptor protein